MAPASASSPMITNAALAEMARESKRAVDWDRILVLRCDDASPSQWKWVANARNFSIYTKSDRANPADQEGPIQKFSVLAVGNVKASVSELTALLTARNQSEYEDKTSAIYGKEFRGGEYLYDVQHEPLPNELAPTQLSVRTVTLGQGNWFARDEALCYLDAIYHDKHSGSVEKLITMLRPEDVVSTERLMASNFAKFHDALVCHRVEPLENQAVDEAHGRTNATQAASGKKQRPVSRVCFYASINAPSSMPNIESLTLSSRGSRTNREAPEDKAMREYLLHLAKDCDRLSTLIRRRRLGLQSLVNKKHFLSRTNKACFVCARRFLVAKVCRICGNGVCKDCSEKYERERRGRGRNAKVTIEIIRVCDPCLDRVESADYSSTTDESLSGPAVVPNTNADAASAQAELGYLLRDALAHSPTPEYQRSVMNVIKCVLDQEESILDHSISSTSPSTPQSFSLTDLRIDNIPYDQASYRSMDDRRYQMDTRNPDTPLTAPISEQEDARVRAVAAVDIDNLADSVELNIICELAARELGCSMSVISIYDRENLNIVASNITSFQKAKMPRWGTPCAHTILESTPNLVPHPEADIRYAESWVVTGHGVKFYFSFPVMGESDQVIGSFCVMNDQSMDVTESKYTAFKKLSEACNKVIRIHSERRRRNSVRSMSTNESTKSSYSL